MFEVVVGLHSADHSALITKWKVLYAPGDTADFGTDLGYNLGDDRLEVLSVVDCACQNDLRNDGNLL